MLDVTRNFIGKIFTLINYTQLSKSMKLLLTVSMLQMTPLQQKTKTTTKKLAVQKL